ncbi:rhamnogalacturonan acetylesterase [Hufsiella ginkgonis]|uniref:rhamnogalacturonan acetylesterase n=1 Tax=Hufsiella ginkgonis TaxID=2695274 RepID=UPI001925CD35|nr:rhamnogalacturonan acetylesterase [Hufsiella ginkgonis]
MKKLTSILLLSGSFILCSFLLAPKSKPTIFLIGDSTVKNGQDTGSNGQWGWGHYLGDWFDSTKVKVVNNALGGTSSRTYRTTGPWNKVLPDIKPGDYVIMQFGHNDASGIDEPARARGTIKGNGDESQEIDNPITKKHETVYSYGWYLRKYIEEIKAKGATPIVCSLIPRNNWKEGKVNRATEGYGKWAMEAAAQGGAYFVDLNGIIADKYDKQGPEMVKSYFASDNLHTVEAGARMNAQCVVEGLRGVKKLKKLTRMLK